MFFCAWRHGELVSKTWPVTHESSFIKQSSDCLQKYHPTIQLLVGHNPDFQKKSPTSVQEVNATISITHYDSPYFMPHQDTDLQLVT